jgi:hypothetical protein
MQRYGEGPREIATVFMTVAWSNITVNKGYKNVSSLLVLRAQGNYRSVHVTANQVERESHLF